MILLATKRAKRWIETVNPANGKVLRRFRASTRTDVEKSVEKARKAFEKWRELSPAKRADFLQRTAKILRSRRSDRVHHAVALSTMAVRPLCISIIDGGKHSSLQTLTRDPAIRSPAA